MSTSPFIDQPSEAIQRMDGKRRSPDDDYPTDSTDPFSLLCDPDFLSCTPNGLLGGSAGPAYNGCSPSSWSTTGMADTMSFTENMPMQLDLGGMSFNELDFNSVEFMNTLLSLDPMLLSDNVLGAAGETSYTPASASSPVVNMNFPLNFWASTPQLGMSTPEGHITTPTPDTQDGQSLRMVSAPSPELSFPTSLPGSDKPMEGVREHDRMRATTITNADTTNQANKVPIPRLPPPIRSNSKSVPSSSARADASPAPSAASGPSRTKLSHCAVERRYRINMRQHLKDLREVVPALRVLELKPGNRISNLSLKPGIRRAGIDADPSAEGEDIIDERGYIDGVEVARNGSKTTVVLKSIEYIRVLKRREMRLKHEQEGLKELVQSFPGGSERLQQWEQEWREKFGGPEKDELEKESAEGRRSSQCDEDFDTTDNGDDNTNMSGPRSLKRARTGPISSDDDGSKAANTSILSRDDTIGPKKYVAIKPAPTSTVAGVSSIAVTQPVKRKRGRPRKNPLPPLPNSPKQDISIVRTKQQPAATTSITQEEHLIASAQPDYQMQHGETHSSGPLLLSMFTFVSFFLSPLPLSSDRNAGRSHAHSGSVLAKPTDHNFLNSLVSSTEVAGLNWRDAIHLIHLCFSAFVVFSVLRPRLLCFAQASRKLLLSSLHQIIMFTSSFRIPVTVMLQFPRVRRDPGAKILAGVRKLKLLANGGLVMPEIEAQVYQEAFGIRPGIMNLLITPLRLMVPPEKHEYWRLERRVFMRLVELVALNANSSLSLRLQVFLGVFRYRYDVSLTATEVASLALLLYPIWRVKSIGLWELAVARVQGKGPSAYICKPFDIFVLETMSVDDAAQGITRLHRNAGARVLRVDPDDGQLRGVYSGHRDLSSPFAALTRQAVHEYIQAQAEVLFAQITSEEQEECSPLTDSEVIEYERLLFAGRSLDPPTVALLNYFDQVYRSKVTRHDIITDPSIAEEIVKEWGDFTAIHSELKALVDAIVLYRDISALTGTGQDGERAVSQVSDALELKRCLASRAFDRSDELRNARTRVLKNLAVN